VNALYCYLALLVASRLIFLCFSPTEAVRAGTMSSSGEVVVVLIGLMLQALLEHMSHASAQVTPQDVIRRVTAQGNAAGIRLGEVRCFSRRYPS
jgi:hypothetical protein